MEHMALQAQMNPHFIFNCLNSIQQFVFNKDIFAANKYITGFARLIRSTLHNSTQANIALTDEVRYLSGYLELEKLRYKDKLNYSIDVDEALNQREVLVPPMLIQPFVENSIRHGLRHKIDGQGHVRINIAPVDGDLLISIEDNGIGREMAADYKTREHIEYHSQGISMTTDRIRLINSVYGKSISMEMIDLHDERGQSTGTQVLIKFLKFEHAFKTEIL
jgi:LytS/YehU family sensor histidine kinase